jgi:N-methylhydantoinase A
VLAPLGLEGRLAAFAVSEVVDENMANAARVHAIEWGKEVSHRALIAFGGAAPLHAARLAEKLDLDRVIVPTGAGVGSAIGFLRAPIAYEVVRSRYQRLSDFDRTAVNAALAEMRTEAYAIVEPAAAGAELAEDRSAYMRYLGQGHEITVALPTRPLEPADVAALQAGFDAAYTRLYGRTIPNLDVEVLSWTLTVKSVVPEPEPVPEAAARPAPAPRGSREVFDSATEKTVEAPVYARAEMAPGCRVAGPALIVEDQTTTVVSSSFEAGVNSLGYIVLTRR